MYVHTGTQRVGLSPFASFVRAVRPLEYVSQDGERTEAHDDGDSAKSGKLEITRPNRPSHSSGFGEYPGQGCQINAEARRAINSERQVMVRPVDEGLKYPVDQRVIHARKDVMHRTFPTFRDAPTTAAPPRVTVEGILKVKSYRAVFGGCLMLSIVTPNFRRCAA
jgi:hypothetical protein